MHSRIRSSFGNVRVGEESGRAAFEEVDAMADNLLPLSSTNF